MCDLNMVSDGGEPNCDETYQALHALRDEWRNFLRETAHPEHFLSVHEPQAPLRRMDGDTLDTARQSFVDARFVFSQHKRRWQTKNGLMIFCEDDLFNWFCNVLSSLTNEREVVPDWRAIEDHYLGIMRDDAVKFLELWKKHDLDRWFPGPDNSDDETEEELSDEENDAGNGVSPSDNGNNKNNNGSSSSSNNNEDDDDHHQNNNHNEIDDQHGDGGDHEDADDNEATNTMTATFFRPCQESEVSRSTSSLNGNIDPHQQSTISSPSAHNQNTGVDGPICSSPNGAAGPSPTLDQASSTLENEGLGAGSPPSPRGDDGQAARSDPSSSNAPDNGLRTHLASSRLSEGNEPTPSTSSFSPANNGKTAGLASSGLSEGNEPGPLLHSSSDPYNPRKARGSMSLSATAMPRSTTTEVSLTDHTPLAALIVDHAPSSSADPRAPTSSPSKPATEQINQIHPRHTGLLRVGTSGDNGPPVWFAWRKRDGGKRPCALFYDNQLNEKPSRDLDLHWHEHLRLDHFQGSAQEKGNRRREQCRRVIQGHLDDLAKKEAEEAAARKEKNARAQAKRLATMQANREKKKRPRETEDSEKTLLGRNEKSAGPKAEKQRSESTFAVVRSPYDTRQKSRTSKSVSTKPFVQGKKLPKPNEAKSTVSAEDTSDTTSSTNDVGNTAITNADGPSTKDPDRTLASHNEMSSEAAAATQKQVTDNPAETPLTTTATSTGNNASSPTVESHQSDHVNDVQHLVRKRPQPVEEEEDQSSLAMDEQQSTLNDKAAEQGDGTSVSRALSPFDQEKNAAWVAHPSNDKSMSGYDHSSASSADRSWAQVESSSSSSKSSVNTAALEQARSSSTPPNLSPDSAHQPSFLPPAHSIYGMHTNTTPPVRKRPRSDEYHEQTEDTEEGSLRPKAKKQKRAHDEPAQAPSSPNVTTPMEGKSLPALSNSPSPEPRWSPQFSPSPPSPCFPRDDTSLPFPSQQAFHATVGMISPPANKRARSAEDAESQEDSEEGIVAPEAKRQKRISKTSAPAHSQSRANTPKSAQSRRALAHPIVPASNLQSSSALQQPFFPAVNTVQPSMSSQGPAIPAVKYKPQSAVYASWLQGVKKMKRKAPKPDRYHKGFLVSSSEDSEEEEVEVAAPPNAKKQKMTKDLTASKYQMDPRAPGYVPRGTGIQPTFGAAHDFMRTTALNRRSSTPSSFASAGNGVTFGTNGTANTGTNSSNAANITSGFNAAVAPSTGATQVSAAKANPTSTGSAFTTVEDTNAAGPTTAGSSDAPPTSSTTTINSTTTAATSAVGPTVTDSTVAAPPTTAGTAAAGSTKAGSSSTNPSTPDVTFLSSQPVARHIKLEPLPYGHTLLTNLLITASTTPNIAPVIIQLFRCADLESLFLAMVAECGYQGNEPVTKLSVTYTWSGRRQLLRRGKEEDWRLFVETVRKGWAGVGEDEAGQERDVEILVHVD